MRSIALAFGFSLLTLGAILACVPCVARRRPSNARTVVVLVLVLWTIPVTLWFSHPPIGLCRAVRTTSWHSQWCTRPCGVTHVVATNVSDVQRVVRGSSSVRVVGAGHSVDALQCADHGGVTLSITPMCWVGRVELDDTVRMGAGCDIAFVQRTLALRGYQLWGFGAIVGQQIGGALSTVLHGNHAYAFANGLVNLTAVLANGSLYSPPSVDLRNAWPGSVGTLGVIVEVTMRVGPVYELECHTRCVEDLSDALRDRDIDSFNARTTSGEVRRRMLKTCTRGRRVPASPALEETNAYVPATYDTFGLAGLGLFSPAAWRVVRDAFVSCQETHALEPSNKVFTLSLINPFFDQEYAFPVSQCEEALHLLQTNTTGFTIIVRRLWAHTDLWLTWASEDVCLIGLSYVDYGVHDPVRDHNAQREWIERNVVRRLGRGAHLGKLWVSDASIMWSALPRVAEFEEYRAALDPEERLQNAYTREMRGTARRSHDAIPDEMTTRLVIWRASVWASVALSVAGGAWWLSE